MAKSILTYIKAGESLIWLETTEEARTLITCSAEFEQLSTGSDPVTFETYSWDMADGIRKIGLKNGRQTSGDPIMKEVDDGNGGKVEMPTTEPLDPLTYLENAPEKTIMFLKDYHACFDKDHCQDHAKAIRKIRNILGKCSSNYKAMVILSPVSQIPIELEKECYKMSFPLPDRDGLRATLKAICKGNGVPYPKDDDAIIDAAMGLTGLEAEKAFAASIVETNGTVEASIVRREKSATVEKTGLLEVVDTSESMDTIGGMEKLKEWVRKSMKLVGEEARAFGARPPKGVLLVGIAGCGKSASAKAIAAASNRPLLRFDMGKMMDKYQGESENHIRSALRTAEAVAPCIFWIS